MAENGGGATEGLAAGCGYSGGRAGPQSPDQGWTETGPACSSDCTPRHYSPLIAVELRSTALEEVPQQARSLQMEVPQMAWLD